MTKPVTLHFAHANGFPASSYRKLFSYLEGQFSIIALEKFAHNPAFPVDQDWSNPVKELSQYLQENSEEPVYLVGHSFGAVVSYMTACKFPQMVKGLIMLDPPLITGLTSMVVRSIRKTPLFDRLTPAHQTLNRCTSWPKGTNLIEYFQNKTLFKDMHPESIANYVDAAIESHESGHSLSFDHKVEANIFRTIPLNIHRFYGKLQVPAKLITGQHTTVCRPKRIAPFIKYNQLEHQEIAQGGHMFPLEQPEKVAQLIEQIITKWEGITVT